MNLQFSIASSLFLEQGLLASPCLSHGIHHSLKLQVKLLSLKDKPQIFMYLQERDFYTLSTSISVAR
jgi:hypothetical protein